MGVNHYSAPESNIYWFRVLGMAGHFQDFGLNGGDFQPDGRLDGNKGRQDAFLCRRHSSAVISHISEGKRPET